MQYNGSKFIIEWIQEYMGSNDASLAKRRHASYILRSLTDEHAFALRGEMLVGRDEDCPIRVQRASPLHAKINVMRSGVYIEDLESITGTFVNGKRIKGRVLLSLDDKVRFDQAAFRLDLEDAQPRARVSTDTDGALEAPQLPNDPKTASADEASDRSAPRVAATLARDGKRPPTKAQQSPADEPEAAEIAVNETPKAPPIGERKQDIGPESTAPPQTTQTHEPHSRPAERAAAIDASILTEEQRQPGSSYGEPITRAPSSEPLDSAPDRPEPAEPQARPEPTPSREQPSLIDLPQSEYTATLEEDEHFTAEAQRQRYQDRSRVASMDFDTGNGPRLIITSAPLRGKLFELGDAEIGTCWKIGRAPEAFLSLTDNSVAADHAQLTKLKEGYQLAATHGRNLIMVNGVEANCTILAADDSIQIGDTVIVFKTDETDDQDDDNADLIDRSASLRHSLVGAAVLALALLAVFIASNM